MTVTPEHQHAPASGAGSLAAAPTSAPADSQAAPAVATRQTAPAPRQPSPEEGAASSAGASQPLPEASDDGMSTASAQTPAAESPPCTAQPTAADRTICGDPELQRLQRELRQAYAEALEAHKDKALLRERQLAWRDARSAIADPERLALAYEQRIQKLKAATADARKQR